MKFRDLKADEIECRVGTINAKGLTLLLYKDARCDMKLLDETVGAMNWMRKHYEHKGNIYCGIAIRDEETGEWVEKEDCGSESYTEKEKGEASDSFKRAGTNWGIGRELYTSPFIWLNKELGGVEQNEKGKFITKKQFYVSEMDVVEKKITKLVICDRKNNNIVYRFEICTDPITDEQRQKIKGLMTQYVKVSGVSYKEINKVVEDHFKKPVASMTAKEAVDVYRFMHEMLGEPYEN